MNTSLCRTILARIASVEVMADQPKTVWNVCATLFNVKKANGRNTFQEHAVDLNVWTMVGLTL